MSDLSLNSDILKYNCVLLLSTYLLCLCVCVRVFTPCFFHSIKESLCGENIYEYVLPFFNFVDNKYIFVNTYLYSYVYFTYF